MKNIHIFAILVLLSFSCQKGTAKEIINIKPQDGDMTAHIRELIEKADDKQIEIIFEKGIYYFSPDYAVGKYCAITNHDNGWKKIIFHLDGYDEVNIIGNGAELVFHGQVLPFQFDNCDKVTMSGITIDWDIPFTIQGEVVTTNSDEEWIDLKMFTEGFSWKVWKGKLTFPNIDGFKYSSLGSSLAFDSKHRRVAHGAWDMSSNPRLVEKMGKGILRIHEKRKQYPKIGNILNFKGPKGANRYAPAVHVISSKNIVIENVIVHYALGMGFLVEKSEDVTLTSCGVYVREGSERVVSTTADATHFCNCKGDILVENCRFQHMLDDGTNVHGTYMKVDKIIDSKTLRAGFGHFQQSGFDFTEAGDEIWFIQQPSPKRGITNIVKSVKLINEQFIEITFINALVDELRNGDLIENKTWNPNFTMKGCIIKDHRARNIVLKTPKKVVIEDNDFSSMMSSVLFRGESFYWFESGSLEDVVIRNNRFNYCAYSGSEHAVLYITPRLGKSFDQTETFDRNIRFINNTISTFDNRIVWADRVDGLQITGNTITHSSMRKSLYPDAPLFEFTNCINVEILDNTYNGKNRNIYKTDKKSQSNISIKNNIGFTNSITTNQD